MIPSSRGQGLVAVTDGRLMRASLALGNVSVAPRDDL
jgi:hypothetical protein